MLATLYLPGGGGKGSDIVSLCWRNLTILLDNIIKFPQKVEQFTRAEQGTAVPMPARIISFCLVHRESAKKNVSSLKSS